MIHFWDRLTAPLIDVLRPSVVLQIGARDGAAILKLIDAIEGTLHVAARHPAFDVEAAQRQAGERLVVHHARGLDVIPQLATPDLVLIDDDPNWYNTHVLLTAIEHRAEQTGRPFPVVVLTQIGWPYARRDSYDAPITIPPQFRQTFERAGILPDQSALAGQSGLFADRCNAVAENEALSGVLTALEDFVRDRPGRFIVARLPMFHGLALLRPADGPAEGALRVLLDAAATALATDLEAARVALEVQASALRHSLAQAAHRNDALHRALRTAQRPPMPTDPSAAALARALWRRVRRALAARLRGGGPVPAATAPAADPALIRSSPMFDAEWYLGQNADVAASGMDPAEHYLRFGAEEGRDPGPGFRTNFYLERYPDVAMAGINPLEHYVAHGQAESRQPR